MSGELRAVSIIKYEIRNTRYERGKGMRHEAGGFFYALKRGSFVWARNVAFMNFMNFMNFQL